MQSTTEVTKYIICLDGVKMTTHLRELTEADIKEYCGIFKAKYCRGQYINDKRFYYFETEGAE